jgi:hypothetical protein
MDSNEHDTKTQLLDGQAALGDGAPERVCGALAFCV